MKSAIMELRKIISGRAITYHSRTPGLRLLPLPAVIIILAVVIANAVAWAAVGIVLVRKDTSYTSFYSTMLTYI